eukprot:COSAG02_NODE_642_length_19038_cov_10.020856_7_plen_99_part_00
MEGGEGMAEDDEAGGAGLVLDGVDYGEVRKRFRCSQLCGRRSSCLHVSRLKRVTHGRTGAAACACGYAYVHGAICMCGLSCLAGWKQNIWLRCAMMKA